MLLHCTMMAPPGDGLIVTELAMIPWESARETGPNRVVSLYHNGDGLSTIIDWMYSKWPVQGSRPGGHPSRSDAPGGGGRGGRGF